MIESSKKNIRIKKGYMYPPIIAILSNRFFCFLNCRTKAEIRHATTATETKNTMLMAVRPDGDIENAKHHPPNAPKRKK